MWVQVQPISLKARWFTSRNNQQQIKTDLGGGLRVAFFLLEVVGLSPLRAGTVVACLCSGRSVASRDCRRLLVFVSSFQDFGGTGEPRRGGNTSGRRFQPLPNEKTVYEQGCIAFPADNVACNPPLRAGTVVACLCSGRPFRTLAALGNPVGVAIHQAGGFNPCQMKNGL